MEVTVDLSTVPDELLEREVRRRRAERTAVLDAKQMPYGWRLVDGTPVEEPGEQRVRFEILRLRQCSLTLRDIAETLNERGLLRSGGVRWRAEQVRRVLLAKPPTERVAK